jgi:hypothetical protein
VSLDVRAMCQHPAKSHLVDWICRRPIEDDGGSNVDCYNEHLKALDGTDDTWFTAAWLFAECYL